MSSSYRLIWFQHFHKAAGTTVVSLARNSGEVFWPYHRNGNPVDKDGFLIPLWNLPKKNLLEFVDMCEEENVTFVASEFGCPNFEMLSSDERVVSITVFRDPLKRFVSNYEYDLIRGNIPRIRMSQYIRRPFLMLKGLNLYTEMLSMHGNANAGYTVKMQLAKDNLAAIDFSVSIDEPDAIMRLCHFTGWSYRNIAENRNSSMVDKLCRAIRMRRWNELYRTIWLEYIYRREDYEDVCNLFVERSALDYELLNILAP